MGEWLGVGAILLALAALVALARECVRRRFHPEVARKVLHVGMGPVLLALPWVFASAWPAVLAACLGGGGLLLLRLSPLWRDGAGKALCAPGRPPWGEPCYALGGCLVFVLYLHGGEPDANPSNLAFYVGSILLLSVADAAAALVGAQWGRREYRFAGGRKTVEGSVAFVAAGFLCALVPLAFLAEVPLAHALAVAFVVAWGTAVVEGVAGHGLDNFFVPVAGYGLLRCCLGLEGPWVYLLVGVALVSLVVAWFATRTAHRGDASHNA